LPLVSGHDGERTGSVPDIHGERDAFGFRCLNVHAPAAGNPGWLTFRMTCTSGDHVLRWKGAEAVF
jgi:hypothetical protein